MHNTDDRSFIGHPRGLGYLAFTEAWERFSYYGMQSLLVLYMVNRLLHPGHIERIAGFGPFRHLLESIYRGPLSVQALASAIFGLYTGLVYLTPIGGGLIADRVLGRTRTVTIGALLMAAGHFLMAFDVTFLAALTCLLTGVGCFKGNLASQVGALYATGDNRRADAFQIYYIFINAGVIAAPLIAGTLGEVYGWHYGFGAAGIGMLIGLTIYRSGRKWLPPDSPIVRKSERAAKIPLTHREKMAIVALLALLPVRVSRLGTGQREPRLLRSQDAHDMADHARFDRVGKLPRRRGGVLATLVEKVSGAGGNYEDRHRQPRGRHRFYLARDWRSDRSEFRRKSFDRLAHHLSRAQQHRFCERLPGLARALCACRTRCIIGHDNRHLLSAPVRREQSRRLDRRPFGKGARDAVLAPARRIVWNSRRHLPCRRPPLRPSPRTRR